MNKYLITVFVPMFGIEFDAMVPNNRKIGTIKKILIDVIKENYSSLFSKSFDDIRLIDRQFGFEYYNDTYIKDSKIKNGTRLVII